MTTNRRWIHEVARATEDARNHFSSKTRIKILSVFQLLNTICYEVKLYDSSTDRKPRLYSCLTCRIVLKLSSNFNTVKLQTQVSFCRKCCFSVGRIHEVALRVENKYDFARTNRHKRSCRAVVSRAQEKKIHEPAQGRARRWVLCTEMNGALRRVLAGAGSWILLL